MTLTAEDSENSRSSRKEPRYEVGDEKTEGPLGETRELSFVRELSMESSFSSGGSSGAESLLRGAWAACLAAGFRAAKAPDEEEVADGAATDVGVDAPASRRADVVETAEVVVTILFCGCNLDMVMSLF